MIVLCMFSFFNCVLHSFYINKIYNELMSIIYPSVFSPEIQLLNIYQHPIAETFVPCKVTRRTNNTNQMVSGEQD